MKKAIVPLGIIILVIFGVFMYLNRFTIFHVSDVDGYVFNTNNIAANLSAGLTENSEKVTYENVKVSDTIYQSGKKYYIGEESKKNVNLDYPIISEDASSVYVLNDTGNYIDSNFIKETTYPNTILTNGHLYNGQNLEKTGEDKYLFLELNNGIYVNLVELNVKRDGGDHVIPVNSFIYFEQSFLRYYTLENKAYKYYEMPNISDYTKTLVGEDEYKYYDLLIYLGVLTPKDDVIDEVIEEIELEPEKPPVVITPSQTTPSQGLVGGETPSGGHVVEEEYVKPVVTLEKTRTGVYSYGGTLSIYDPTSRIYKTPTLEYKYKGSVYLRNSFNKSGVIETIGLMPNTTYEVTGYYYYHDEFQQKMKNTFLKIEITTGDISTLETFDMSIDGTTPDIRSVVINGIQLHNNPKDEVLKGLKNGVAHIGQVSLKLNTGDIKNLTALEKIDYKTDKILQSNTTYNSYIELIDIAGNVMKIKGNTFNFTTLKAPPSAKISVQLSKNFTQAELKFEVSNPDKMQDTRYTYYVYDALGNLLGIEAHNGQGSLNEGTNVKVVKNLYAESLYVVKVYADYRSSSGEMVTDYLLASYEFITYDVGRLGAIDFTVDVKSVTQEAAVISFQYTNYKETNPVFELIEQDIKIVIYDLMDPTVRHEQSYDKMNFQSPVEITLTKPDFVISTDTVYRIEIIPIIKSNDREYEVETNLSTKEFQTLKNDAEVFMNSGFVSLGYVDYDVCVLDADGAIIGEDVLVKIVDSDGNVEHIENIKKRSSCTPGEGETSQEVYTRISAKGLDADTYSLQVEAPEYNTGHMNNTLKSNYTIRSESVKVQGTTGDLQLNSLINMVNYNVGEYKKNAGMLDFDIVDDINLFDISNNTRWKTAGHQNTSDLKEIKIEDNEVVLAAYKGWRQYSYYMPELKGSTFILSFDYKYTVGTVSGQKICISFDDDSQMCQKNITADLSTDENPERISYLINATETTVGEYITFYIYESESTSKRTELKLKNVKLELIQTVEETASDYTAFGDKSGITYETAYAGTFTVQFNDVITNKVTVNGDVGKELYFNELEYDYMVRFFINGEEITTMDHIYEFEKINQYTNQLVTNPPPETFTNIDIPADADFEARLSLRAAISDGTEDGYIRYYDLKTVEFTSEAETRTITNVEEFLNMHMYGYYLVSTDLNLTENTSGYSGTFQGSLDFQGHKVTISQKSGLTYLINRIGGGGTVKNLDLHFLLNQDTIDEWYYGLVYENYGLISNVKLTVDSSVEPIRTRYYTVQEDAFDEDGNPIKVDKTYSYTEATGHKYFSLMGEENYGTIENFVVDLQQPIYCMHSCTAGFRVNSGTMKNGYIIGENIEAGYTADGTSKDVGLFAVTSSTNSKIENVYSIMDIMLGSNLYAEDGSFTNDHLVGNLVYSASSAEITNVIQVDPRIVYQGEEKYLYNTTYRNYSKDVSIYTNSNSILEDIYYIGNFNYQNNKTQEAVISHLSNESFMSARLNSENKFNTVEAWQAGVFPTLKWPEYMPKQEVIPIPKKNESNYLKILSVDSVIQDKNHKDFKDQYKTDYFARVQLSIYNPRSLKIAGLTIEGIGNSKNANQIVVDSQTAGNSDKIGILTIYVKSPDVFKTNYQVQDIYVNRSNENNVMSGTTASCENGKIVNEIDCSDFPILSLDLYKYVETLKDIEDAQKAGHLNFRMTKDIDLNGINNMKLPAITGVLDGDGYAIKNITTSNCFVPSLSGTIKNLNIETLTITQNSGTYAAYGSFICTSTAGGIVDNVHVSNVKVTAGGADTLYLSGLIADAKNTKIRNSSVSDFQIIGHSGMKGKNAYAGGMVAKTSSTNITNSFVRRVNMQLEAYVAADEKTNTPETLGVSKYLAAGGMVGYMENGVIENVYATGTINSKFGTAGGIAGETSGYIRSAITKVNIYTIGDNIGGILGNISSDDTNLASKTLVMGDILTSSDSAANLDRTSGTQLTPNQNFAWNRQSINSIVSANTKMEELLDDTELNNSVVYNSKIGLSEFDFAVSVDNYKKRYDENGQLIPEFIMVENEFGVEEAQTLEYGLIPKILHTSTGKLLNNQEAAADTIINYVELFSLLEDPTVTYMKNTHPTDFSLHKRVEDPWDADYVMVSMTLKNVNNFALANITLEDLEYLPGTNIEVGSNSDGITEVSFRAKASLNKNYDSYKITGIEYFTKDFNGNTITDTYTQVIKLTIPFYGQIKTAEDWQSIKAGTYQNFVLVNDIDLSGVGENKANINISFNKLVGLDQTVYDENGDPLIDDYGREVKRAPIIKGITRTGLTNNVGVIDTIVSEIRNISFDNITLKATTNRGSNYFGIIKNLNGTMKGSWDQTTNTYQRMRFTNIHLDGQKISYVGIIALNKSPDIHYIEFSNVYVKGASRVGGLIGSSYAVDKTDIIGNNIYIEASGSYIGALYGYENHYWSKTFTFNTTLTGVYVKGASYVGGAYGYGSGREITVKGTPNEKHSSGNPYNIVYGTSAYVGGVAGQFSSCYPYYNYAYDLDITGTYNTGGVCGYRWNCYNAMMVNCNVTGTYRVGGISGYSAYTLLNSTVVGGTIKGNYDVGALCGRVDNGSIYDNQVAIYPIANGQGITRVIGRNATAYNLGGVVGYLNTSACTVCRNEVTAIVQGYKQIGGAIGLMENRNESKSASKHNVYDNLIANCTLISTSPDKAYIGGLIGRVERNFPYGYIYDNIISVSIKAETDNMVGYAFGGSEYWYENVIKDSEGNVVERIKVDFTETFGDNFMYQKNETSVLSYTNRTQIYQDSTLITPSRGENGIKFGDHLLAINATENAIPVAYVKSLTLDELKSWSLYSILNRGVMARASVDASKTTGLEYFPYMTRAQGVVNYPTPISNNLPGTDYVYYSTTNTPMYHILPDFKVYAVDVDKINIEFADVDPYTKLEVNGLSYSVEQTVFTFYYDFNEDFEVTIKDDYNEKTTLITADEVKNGVTVIGEYFYYLKDGEVITNNQKITLEDETVPEESENEKDEYESNGNVQIPTQNQTEKPAEEENSSSEPGSNTDIVAYVTNNLTALSVGGTVGLGRSLAISDTKDNTKTVVDGATNIYGNEILLDNKDIYNIETGETYENDFDNLTLAETQSLHEYNYAGQRIETFYYHTLIDGKRVDKQVYVKNGQIEIIASEIDNKKNQILVDNYNDKNYLIYLGSDGKLYSIKDDIVFPKGFKNINIKSISTNADSNTDMVFVEYNDGSYTVFNYRTGQLIIKQSDENISLEDYIKQYLELSYDSVTSSSNPNYESAKKLVEKLNSRPLSSFHNGESTTGIGTLDSTKYSIVYNPSTGKYDVYELPGENDSNVTSLTTSLGKTVDSIIDQDPLMIEYYREAEGRKVTLISAILIVIGIVLGITGAVLVLGRNVKKEKKISSQRKEVKA